MKFFSQGCLVTVLSFSLFATVANADPELFVTYEGVNSNGNNTWAARISPDPNFFVDTTSGFGSSLALELAFSVEGSEFVTVTKDPFNWDFDTPGVNPFTIPDFTDGIWISDDSTDAFASLGSPVFLDAGPFDTLFFETLGSGETTLLYGTAASGDNRLGALIAQAGIAFETMTLSAPLAFQSPVLPQTGGVSTFSQPTLLEFTGYGGSVSSIPEPSTTILAVSGFLALAAFLRRK